MSAKTRVNRKTCATPRKNSPGRMIHQSTFPPKEITMPDPETGIVGTYLVKQKGLTFVRKVGA